MSTELYNNGDFNVTSYWGGENNGKMLQFTMGASSYRQFTRQEIEELAFILNVWLYVKEEVDKQK